MELKNLFNQWAVSTEGRYRSNQWLLSKWDTLDGLPFSEERVSALMGYVSDHIRASSCRRILDAGCGGGWMTERLSALGSHCVGVDIAMEMLRFCDHKKNKFVCGNLCSLPFRSGIFDGVVCYFVLINFMDLVDVERVVDELLRVTRPGGRILIGQLPDKERSLEYDQAKESYREFCLEQFPGLQETRDQHPIPIQLYARDFWTSLLDTKACSYRIINAFNPFFHKGRPLTIPWRFDIVIEKEDV